ncbi:hypothetical protein ACLB2K_038397 [Fragaria x ananassa]
MPRIGFTRVREAWCRVPKSPRESREVTSVMFQKQVARRNVCYCSDESVRAWLGTSYVALRPLRGNQSALAWGLLLCGESVHAWLGTVARWPVSPRLVGEWLCGESVRAWLRTVGRWPVSPRLVGDCGYVASQSALGWRVVVPLECQGPWGNQ